jgi:hypothetical protein
MTPLGIVALYSFVVLCVATLLFFPDGRESLISESLGQEASPLVLWSIALVWPLAVAGLCLFVLALAFRLAVRGILAGARAWT